MKTRYNQLFILCFMSLFLFSCEKDEDRVMLSTEGAPALATSSSAMVLAQENGTAEAVKFTWSPLSLKWSQPNVAFDAVEYAVQLAPKGTDFANYSEAIVANSTEKVFTVSELNAILTQLKVPAEVPAMIDVRIKAEYGANVAPLYSEPITITVTPYRDIPVYPSLYVPGQYQGWSPDVADRISSPTDNGVYEGYIYMGVADGFKFTSAPNWDNTNYGDGGEGKLSTDGGAGNLTVKAPGFYLFKANTKSLTWSAEATNWAIVGDATGSWDNDTDMTYDVANKVWKVTKALSVGEMKFRANDKWELNFGDEKDDRPADGILEYGSDNIAITEAGTYEITLDLSNPGYYLYNLKKQ